MTALVAGNRPTSTTGLSGQRRTDWPQIVSGPGKVGTIAAREPKLPAKRGAVLLSPYSLHGLQNASRRR
jgi:hypothetical protein